MSDKAQNIVDMTGTNGDKVMLEEYEGGSTILSHSDKDGNILSRTCSGRCGNTQLGPINCPPGKSPDLNCARRPPTLGCR